MTTVVRSTQHHRRAEHIQGLTVVRSTLHHRAR